MNICIKYSVKNIISKISYVKWKFLKVSSISKVIFPSRALFASNCVWLRTLLYQLPRLFCLPPTLSYLNGHSLHIMKPFLVSDFFISRLMPYSCKDATRTECIITWIYVVFKFYYHIMKVYTYILKEPKAVFGIIWSIDKFLY